MSLITLDELARGLIIGTLGGAAGLCTLSFPGSALWLLPAGLAVGGCALTVPEIRQEAARALPYVPSAVLPAFVRRRLPGGTPQTPQTAMPTTPPVEPTTLPQPQTLVQTLEESPHRLIIGHTRGGKTTLIHHMATAWAARGERVLVADPDAAPGLWPGCAVAGAGDDLEAIGELLTQVQGEVTHRRAERAQGVREFAPLHLVVDEAQDVLPTIPGAMALFEDIARRGGKLNIRLTVGVQDRQVKTLGLEGKSALLSNLQVADVMKGRDGQRVAVLRDAVTGERSTVPIPDLPNPERLIIRRSNAVQAGADKDLLASFLGNPIPTQGGIGLPEGRNNVTVDTPDGHTTVVNVVQVHPTKSPAVPQSPVDTSERDAAYRAAGAAGETLAGAYKRLGGSRDGAHAAWLAGKPAKKATKKGSDHA